MTLDAAQALISLSSPQTAPQGLSKVGDVVRVRLGADVVLLSRAHGWTLALLDLLGPSAFAKAALDDSADIASMGRGVVRARVDDDGTVQLMGYAITHRHARELLRQKPKKRTLVETVHARRLDSAHGRKQGHRPGSSRASLAA